MKAGSLHPGPKESYVRMALHDILLLVFSDKRNIIGTIMGPGKFVLLFRTFDKPSRKRFRTFLGSAYPARQSLLVRLFDLVITMDVEEDANRQKIWEELYEGKKEYNYSHFRKLMSDLAKEVERFLQVELQAASEVPEKRLLLEELRERNLPKYFLQHYKQFQGWFEKHEGNHSPEAYLEQYYVEFEKYKFDAHQRRAPGDFGPMITGLDLFYHLKRIQIGIELSILNGMFAIETKGSEDFESILKEVEALKSTDFFSIPIVRININLFDLYQSAGFRETQSFLRDILNTIEEHGNTFASGELQYIFSHTINICTIGANFGDAKQQEFHQQFMLEVYEHPHFVKCILKQEALNPWHYKNFAMLLLRNGHLKKAKAFLEEKRFGLPKQLRDNAYHLTRATYHYFRQEYGDTKRYLQLVGLEDEFFAIDTRSLLLITYLETDDFEPLFSLIDSFQRYLDRNKLISENRRISQKNRLKICRKFVKILTGPRVRVDNLITLRRNIFEIGPVTNRSHLIALVDKQIAIHSKKKR